MTQTDPSPGLVVPTLGVATPAPGLRAPGGGDMGLDAQVFNRLLRERIIFLGSAVMEAARITDSAGAAVDLEELRDDLVPSGADDTEFDDEGRPFHTHADGSVHYLDEG